MPRTRTDHGWRPERPATVPFSAISLGLASVRSRAVAAPSVIERAVGAEGASDPERFTGRNAGAPSIPARFSGNAHGGHARAAASRTAVARDGVAGPGVALPPDDVTKEAG